MISPFTEVKLQQYCSQVKAVFVAFQVMENPDVQALIHQSAQSPALETGQA